MGGFVYGGQSPLIGAAVYAFSSGTGAYGAASTSEIALDGGVQNYPPTAGTYGNYVPTDLTGYFEIEASTPCVTGAITYLYALGGNAGSGTNTAAGQMVALGVCTDGLLIDSVTSTRVHMNEVSTVAAAFALAGFATTATSISAPSASDTLAATGIHNAVANAAQLYSFVPNTSDAASVANATTPNGNGTVPQAEIDTIANSLAACVNATATASQCTTLLGAAKSAGTTGTTPTDTATAAINIAHYPGSNVTTIYNLGTTTPQFAPALTAAPNDFTIQLAFTDASIVLIEYLSPKTLSIDASGNVWNANESTGTVTLLSPLGVSANSAGFATDAGTFSTAINAAGIAWTANFDSSSISRVTPAGVVTNYTPAAVNEPTDAQFDGSGNLFVANAGANTILKITPAFVVTKSTASTEDLNFPYSVSLEAGSAGAVWAGNAGDPDISFLTNALVGTSDKAEGTGLYKADSTISGTAVDASGNLWAAVQNDDAAAGEGVAEVTTANVSTLYKPGASQHYLPEPNTIAIDGSSNVWVGDSDDGTIYELNSTGMIVSPTYGYILTDNSDYAGGANVVINSEVNSIAVDGSGDVWFTAANNTTGVETIREMVGGGVPVYTPLSAAAANSKLGQKP